MSDTEDLVNALKKYSGRPQDQIPKALKDTMKLLMKEQQEDIKPEPTELYANFNPPRLPTFSGKDRPGNGETTFELWRYEVRCLQEQKIHPDELIVQAIRRSLKGDAAKILMRLGPKPDIFLILNKMDTVFGIAEEKESILREFYNASQQEDEDVISWSFRLEDILEKAIQLRKVTRSDGDHMLHDMLWKGLKPEMKAISHYEKEKYTTFDSLRAALRRMEKDASLDYSPPVKSAKGTSKKAVTKTSDSDDDDLKTTLKSINTRLERLETGTCKQQYFKHQGPGQYNAGSRGKSFFRGRGGYNNRRPYRGNNRGSYHDYQEPRYKGGADYQPPMYDQGTSYQESKYDKRDYNDSQQRATGPRSCDRCGQVGHLAKGCLNTVGQYRHLNAKESTSRGRK